MNCLQHQTNEQIWYSPSLRSSNMAIEKAPVFFCDRGVLPFTLRRHCNDGNWMGVTTPEWPNSDWWVSGYIVQSELCSVIMVHYHWWLYNVIKWLVIYVDHALYNQSLPNISPRPGTHPGQCTRGHPSSRNFSDTEAGIMSIFRCHQKWPLGKRWENIANPWKSTAHICKYYEKIWQTMIKQWNL